MDTLQIALLAFVQGLTEFLPISSSGHLILTPLLFGYELQDLSFDIAVHLGTLLAVLTYFRRDLLAIGVGMAGSLAGGMVGNRLRRRALSPAAAADARLGWMVVLATLPILVLGLPLKTLLDGLRQDDQLIALVVASTTIGFGLLLWYADVRGRHRLDLHAINWAAALIIGCFQAIAIIPGTSRSGITITAGLFLGLTRQAASRFSFLLSIPTISLAGLLAGRELLESAVPVDWHALWLGALLSFVVAYLSIHLFLRFIERVSMLPFVLYRLLLGGLILFLLLM
ncbi:undecaprenyl-diphosphate phosphatase [Thiohalocapsa marina]|uniref:Undecaprenyl-diphosphatase n=1 Tax=Thiohalocapsa marina TaxID=424902 RepID=A0A5M8FDB1_9GAMM|nr:undecaprenyl-diphosphate phosphatase [Thiohalocapsa marina]KAA6181890.1 undecaprenyl-diphosphate phosphatase [Thiohalocapsa marina]